MKPRPALRFDLGDERGEPVAIHFAVFVDQRGIRRAIHDANRARTTVQPDACQEQREERGDGSDPCGDSRSRRDADRSLCVFRLLHVRDSAALAMAPSSKAALVVVSAPDMDPTRGAQNESEPAANAREPHAWIALPLLAGIAFVGLALHAASLETPTADEFAHLPAGVAAWRQGRTDLYRSNPPLPKLLLAAPVALDPSVTSPPVVETPLLWGPWEYGHRFMNANRDQYLALIFRARWAAIAFGVLAGFVVFRWARDVFGVRSAALVTSLFLLDPNVLAHGHLATIDMGALASILLAMFALRWAYLRPGTVRFLVAGAALGFALAIKFLGVLILPAFAVLAIAHRWRDAEMSVAQRLALALRDLAVMLFAALFVTNASIGFEGSLLPLGALELRSQFGRGLQSVLPAWLPVPLPREYVLGFDAAKEISEHGEFGSYLLGRWSEHGWWYYNLVALGVKVPIAILGCFAAAGFFWWRSRLDRIELLSLLIPFAALIVVFSTASNLNIGIRHVLPALPFGFLLLGPIFQVSASRARERVVCAIASVALATAAYDAAEIHPDSLTFFNAIAGGPDHGGEWLLDSNLDWGQDLYRVPAAVASIDPDATPFLLYFGHVDPALYGLRYQLLPSTPVEGILAVSENFLRGQPYLTVAPNGVMTGVAGDTAAWLRTETPVLRLGSIVLFDTRRVR